MGRPAEVSAALATLQARWGAAAPRTGGELGLVVEGALARAPMPMPVEAAEPDRRARSSRRHGRRRPRRPHRVRRARRDPRAGRLPRSASVALKGDHSSGKTTVALRLVAEAQASGIDRRVAGPRPRVRPGRGRRARHPARVARGPHAHRPRGGARAVRPRSSRPGPSTCCCSTCRRPATRTVGGSSPGTGSAGWPRSPGEPGRCWSCSSPPRRGPPGHGRRGGDRAAAGARATRLDPARARRRRPGGRR